MLENPDVGHQYAQENAPGVAEDQAQVISLNATVSDIPYLDGGTFGGALQTLETTPLEPGAAEFKYYIPDVGLVLVVDANTGEVQEQLVKIQFAGTQNADTIVGKIGADELLGFAGNDTFVGSGGNDTATGGAGNDTYIVHETDGQLTITDFRPGSPGTCSISPTPRSTPSRRCWPMRPARAMPP